MSKETPQHLPSALSKTYIQLIREGWLPIEEAKDRLGYSSRSSLNTYCIEGRIEAIKIGGRWLISQEGLRQAEAIKPRRRAEKRK